jgi:hypothetical protein
MLHFFAFVYRKQWHYNHVLANLLSLCVFFLNAKLSAKIRLHIYFFSGLDICLLQFNCNQNVLIPLIHITCR